MLRYVVLHHVGHGPPHFDLMLERDGGGLLRTFRVAAWPVSSRRELTPLADHRRAYLDYEGAVGGGRGTVRRVEAGTHLGGPLGHQERVPFVLRLNCAEVDGRPVRRRLYTLALTRDPDGTLWADPIAHAVKQK